MSTQLSQPASSQPSFDPLHDSRQCLVVVTPAWDEPRGILRRYLRDDLDAEWVKQSPELPVVVGRNGMAWGYGIHPAIGAPRKHEGDGKAPAGLFELGRAFGFPPADTLKGWAWPYQQVGEGWCCVDDPQSRYYNQLLRYEQAETRDWVSAERMAEIGAPYEWGIVIMQNMNPTRPGGGSCVFLHVWSSPGRPTVGCTAMAREAMVELIGWLQPDKKPRLIQLPEPIYRQVQSAWNLPSL